MSEGEDTAGRSFMITGDDAETTTLLVALLNREDLSTDERVVASVAMNWILFKHTHDVESLKITCCELSRTLFESLQALVDQVSSDVRESQPSVLPKNDPPINPKVN